MHQAQHHSSGNVKELLSLAVSHHQAGKLAEAEKLYRQILELDAENPDALHLLGVIAHQTGDNESAIQLIESSIRIKKSVPFYHNSLGNALFALGKIDEAARAYEKALALDPNYAEAHLNIGNILRKQGKPIKAAARYELAISLNPNYATAHMNLGNVMFDRGKFNEAVVSYERAIVLLPEYAEAHNNLGITLLSQGKMDDAQSCFKRAISIKPNYEEARDHLRLTQFIITPVYEWDKLCAQLLEQSGLSNKAVHEIKVRLAICLWSKEDLEGVEKVLEECASIEEIKYIAEKNIINMRTYENFLRALLKYVSQEKNSVDQTFENKIALIGDSHCLSFANTNLNVEDIEYNVVPHLIMGCKAWHLSKEGLNQYKWSLKKTIERLQPQTKCLIMFGEIDCRYNEGIIGHYKKLGNNAHKITTAFVKNYTQNVAEIANAKKHEVSFINIPAPNVNALRKAHPDFTTEDEELLVSVIGMFNDELKTAAKSCGCGHIDLYAVTAGTGGKADGKLHIDEHHLKPEALRIAVSGK